MATAAAAAAAARRGTYSARRMGGGVRLRASSSSDSDSDTDPTSSRLPSRASPRQMGTPRLVLTGKESDGRKNLLASPRGLATGNDSDDLARQNVLSSPGGLVRQVGSPSSLAGSLVSTSASPRREAGPGLAVSPVLSPSLLGDKVSLVSPILALSDRLVGHPPFATLVTVFSLRVPIESPVFFNAKCSAFQSSFISPPCTFQSVPSFGCLLYPQNMQECR